MSIVDTVSSWTHSLKRSYVLALMILGGLALCTYAVMDQMIHAQTRHQRLSSLGGEQRVLFQRIGIVSRRLMTEIAEPVPNPVLVPRLQAELKDVIGRLRETQSQMDQMTESITGSWFSSRASPQAIYQGEPYRLGARLQEFVRRATTLAEADVELVRHHARIWSTLEVTVASNGLLMRGLDAAMAALNQEALENIERIRQAHQLLTLLTLIALVAEAIWIFRPLVTNLQTELRRNERQQKKLNHLVHHDALTGLANRIQLNRLMLAEMSSPSVDFALLLIDLDGFKPINDTYGHQAGDILLQTLARRLNALIRDQDLVARVGGDEFGVILSRPGDDHAVDEVVERLHRALCEPISYENRLISVGASIGVARCPQDARDLDELMSAADLAMYAAKSDRQKKVCRFDPVLLKRRPGARERAEIERALAASEILPYYQPKVLLATECVVGFEALVRWRNPERGLIMPSGFLDQIGILGLHTALADTLIRQIFADLVYWRGRGLDPGRIALNLAEATLVNPDACRALEDLLDRHDFLAPHLSIEITEDVFLARASSQIKKQMARLIDRGVEVSLDDFGTGYASLTHLREFPFHQLKIDRSFVRDIGKRDSAELIIESIVQLAHGLSCNVVAEGVETAAQRSYLSWVGCDLGQGFLWSPAIDAQAVTDLLQAGVSLADAAEGRRQVASL